MTLDLNHTLSVRENAVNKNKTSVLIEENVLLLDGLLLVDEVGLGMVLLHQVSVLYLNSSS